MKYLQDNSGNFSSMRLINLIIILVLCLNWIYSTIKFGAFNPSSELVALVLGLIFGKVWQKKIEISEDKNI